MHRGLQMNILSKALMAAGIVVTLAGAACADDAGPWVLRDGMAYVVDMQGHTMIINLPTMTKAKMAKATVVRRGTIFFMHDGKLMMMYDRTGIESAH